MKRFVETIKNIWGIAELKDKIFTMDGSISGSQADKFSKIKKAIGEYVGRVYGHNMKVLVMNGKESVFQEPAFPEGNDSTERTKAIWSKQYDMWAKKKDQYDDYKAKVFNLITGRCDKPLKNRVASLSC